MILNLCLFNHCQLLNFTVFSLPLQPTNNLQRYKTISSLQCPASLQIEQEANVAAAEFG